MERQNKEEKKKYKIITFGCQMNEHDSEKLAGILEESGYVKVNGEEQSDLIIYNTCCIRENAELKVYGHLGSLKKAKEENPGMIIAVCGCMMQQKEVVEHIKTKYRHVDIIIGTHNMHRFPELLDDAVNSGKSIIEVRDTEGKIEENIPIKRLNRIKAWVTVMYGCNNFCSYCVVPYVRGRERSRNIENIIEEVRMLGQQGYKEITLLGQNVNSYGKDLRSGSFSRLLYELNNIDGLERIRFMTSHPKDLSKELIYALRDCDKVCEHLHLPIQSGSTKILNEMNRKYTKEQYLELITCIRENIPGISITTDIIVGYPGETEEDFDETMDVLKKIRFDSVYTFLYSRRSGTAAAQSPDQISEDIKKKRFARMIEVQNHISKEINEDLMGKEFEILVEGMSKNSIKTYTGRTRTNKIVNFKGDNSMIGKLVNVKIEKIQTWSLGGRVV